MGICRILDGFTDNDDGYIQEFGLVLPFSFIYHTFSITVSIYIVTEANIRDIQSPKPNFRLQTLKNLYQSDKLVRIKEIWKFIGPF